MNTAIIVVQCLIGLIVMITFFVMASNVSKIKKMLEGNIPFAPWHDPDFMKKVYEEIAVGNKEKAAEMLKRAKYRYTHSDEVKKFYSQYSNNKLVLNEEAYNRFINLVDEALKDTE